MSECEPWKSWEQTNRILNGDKKMTNQPDPIQTAFEALEYLTNWQAKDGASVVVEVATEGLEALRAHQSEVAALKSVNQSQRKNLDRLYSEGIRDQQQITALKSAVRDLGMFIKAEAATSNMAEILYNEHAATIKAAGGE